MRHTKQKNTAHNEISQLIKTDPKLTSNLELTEKEFKTVIVQNIRQRHGRYKKIQIELLKVKTMEQGLVADQTLQKKGVLNLEDAEIETMQNGAQKGKGLKQK